MRRGSAFSRTIGGRESEVAREVGIGAQIRPLSEEYDDIRPKDSGGAENVSIGNSILTWYVES